jgi:hypothetical protein
MPKKLSTSTEKKEFIRFIWSKYISKYLSLHEDIEDYEIKILTLVTEGLLDVREFLKIEEISLDNIICVTNQNQVKDEFTKLMSDVGKDLNKCNQYFFAQKIEDLLHNHRIKEFIDIYNLDYSNTFFSQSKSETHRYAAEPQGISTVFSYAKHFGKPFTIFLTNKIDLNREKEIEEFKKINSFLLAELNQQFFINEDEYSNLIQAVFSILLTITSIALKSYFRIRRIFPYIYSPEGTYYMLMSIIEFETIDPSIFEQFIGISKKKYLVTELEKLRDAVTEVRIIEST